MIKQEKNNIEIENWIDIYEIYEINEQKSKYVAYESDTFYDMFRARVPNLATNNSFETRVFSVWS